MEEDSRKTFSISKSVNNESSKIQSKFSGSMSKRLQEEDKVIDSYKPIIPSEIADSENKKNIGSKLSSLGKQMKEQCSVSSILCKKIRGK